VFDLLIGKERLMSFERVSQDIFSRSLSMVMGDW
jgi:hypothetical protein